MKLYNFFFSSLISISNCSHLQVSGSEPLIYDLAELVQSVLQGFVYFGFVMHEFDSAGFIGHELYPFYQAFLVGMGGISGEGIEKLA